MAKLRTTREANLRELLLVVQNQTLKSAKKPKSKLSGLCTGTPGTVGCSVHIRVARALDLFYLYTVLPKQ